MEATDPKDSDVLLIKGNFYINYAWEARGGGWANTVTPQGWRDFAARLATAEEALTRAWELDPTNAGPPTKMLTVALGEDKDRDEMEKWFQRAMDANPDNYDACTSKLYYLEPKWHGSPEAMLEFGHQCFDSQNWHGDVAFVLLDAHIALSKYQPDPKLYYRNEIVWSDFCTVYTAYLNAYPTDDQIRSKFAYYACLCGHWTEANDLFKKLGGNADPDVFGNAATLNDFKQRAAGLATTKP